MRARTQGETTIATRSRGWLWYDNDGSYNREFDWVARHLRVGPWSRIVILSLSAAPLILLCSRPTSDFESRPSAKLFSSDHLIDVALFIWCITIITVCKKYEKTISGLSYSYSGWTWLLLTARCAAGTKIAPILERI